MEWILAYLDFVMRMTPVLRKSRWIDFIIWDALSPFPGGRVALGPLGRKPASRNLEANRTPERSK